MMDYIEGLERLREISTGDKEREALESVEQAMEAYRSLYEGAEKKIMRYRDVASKPDISLQTHHKDSFNDLQTALRFFKDERGLSRDEGIDYKAFAEWLFSEGYDEVKSRSCGCC